MKEEKRCYYHLCANGDDAKNFIICEKDYKAAFNRIAVAAWVSGAVVLAFSIEDSHPHALLYGTYSQSMAFKHQYEVSTRHYIAATRKSLDGVIFECELLLVDSDDYLKTVGAYVIVQATKDGKAVMPYDYLYGTGSLYFRSPRNISLWTIDEGGRVMTPRPLGGFTTRERHDIVCSSVRLPDDWLVCDGLILPENYVDIERYEKIYSTHNCFRTFQNNGKKKFEEVTARMAMARGVVMEDLEARKLCADICHSLYGKKDTRWLDVTQRLTVAIRLRHDHHLSIRQISTLARLPESEIRKYL